MHGQITEAINQIQILGEMVNRKCILQDINKKVKNNK